MGSPPDRDPDVTEPTPEDEERLVSQKKAKLAELEADGVELYPNGFADVEDIGEVLAHFDELPPDPPTPAGPGPQPFSDRRFRVAGRIVAYRAHGATTFVKVHDRTGTIQVFVRKDRVGSEAYALLRKLERGDFLWARGGAFVTRTGERSVLADSLGHVSWAVRRPPEKWHGLSDVETRYRQRYVDLVANQEVAEVFRRRSRVIKQLRATLEARDFLEVETPMMHSVQGGAAARPFETHHNALGLPLFLRIAPELFLKRLVVGGFERVYEIGRNFRNEGLSRQHNPEFTMLEVYQAYATFEEMMTLTEALILECAQELQVGATVTYQGHELDLTPPWPRVTMRQAVARALETSTADVDDDDSLSRLIESRGLATRSDELGTALRRAGSYGERLGALFDYLGEEKLPQERPVFVVEYPTETSPLSRRNNDDPRFVDRFELFVMGREHANGFSEINDPADQRARFQRQVEMRDRGDQEAMEYDEDYCRALETGMPPAGGLGVGVDRLVMLLCDQPSIRDVILFPLMRPER